VFPIVRANRGELPWCSERTAEEVRIDSKAIVENELLLAALKCAGENFSSAPSGLDPCPLGPRACALGCILTPLRGS